MRLTSIDIGTNTILMLIADVGPGNAVTPVRDDQVIARLGKGVDAHRMITAETMNRVLGFLRSYKETSDSLGSNKIIACGTSALRDASNRREFIDLIWKTLGLEVTVLTGEEEADLTFLGAVSGFSWSDGDKPQAVLDIGGGSTELTTGKNGVVASRVSLDLGSVRLTERILRSSPPSAKSLGLALEEVEKQTSALPRLPSGTQLTGVAGTATTLAAIDLNLKEYDRLRVNGHTLSLSAIDLIFENLKTCDLEQMAHDYPQIEAGRKDIILAGIIILIGSMKRLSVDCIRVSDRGLRFGIALREYSRQADNRRQ